MSHFDKHTVVLLMMLLISVTINQSCGNVLMMTTEEAGPPEHASDSYDSESEEFFDPSNQPQQFEFNIFQDAQRELALMVDDTDQTTTSGDIYATDGQSSTSNDTDIEPEHQSSLDPSESAVTFANLDPITSPPSDVKSVVAPLAVAATPLLLATSAIPIPVHTTSPTITTAAIVRRIKKIQTTQSPPPLLKQNANEILQRLLDDQYIRTPMAALIDTSAEALRKSKMLWKSALRPQAPLDIVLVAYNSTGIGVTYSFKNTRTMVAGLESIHESQPERGTAFFGIMRASELIPYDSAIFVCTDDVSLDENLGQYAALTLLKKRIRLYLIWFGSPTTTTDINDANGNTSVDGGMLGEVALKSGGQIIRVTEDTVDGPNGGLALITLYLQKNVLGANEVEIPEPAAVHSADDDPQLKVVDDRNRTEKLTTSNVIFSTDGINLGQKIRKTRSESNDEGEFSPGNTLDAEVNTGSNILPDSTMQENNITEVDGILGRNTLQAVTIIQMGIQSQLLANPGTTIQLYFEVTNLREESTFHNFQVADEKRYLQTLSPLSVWLTAGQTTTAVVTAFIPPNTEIGTTDKITFTSQGLGLASQAATLTVTGNGALLDSKSPNLYWAYGSRCDYKTGPGQCASAVWSLEVTSQDLDTGILRIQSKPAGLTVRNAFVVGTNNEVKATYTSSCCVTRVTITAVDVAGNQRTVTLDVTEFLLNEASIAAIALGVVLILVIILVAVLLCVWCSRKRRESRDLELFRARSAGQPSNQ